MLIEILINFTLWLLDHLLDGLQLMQLPSDVMTVFATLTAYLIEGMRVVCAYIHVPYIFALLTAVIALNGFINVWHFLLFVLRKIPFVHIS